MTVLVTAASKHGATREIAEAIDWDEIKRWAGEITTQLRQQS